MFLLRVRSVLTLAVIGLAAIGLFVQRPIVARADSGVGGGTTSVAMSPAVQPSTYVGVATEWRFVFTGETSFVHPVWSIASGSLPEGMALTYPASGANADRMVAKISGVPRSAGTFQIVLRADPGWIGGRADKAYALMVNPMDIPPAPLPTARAGVAYAQSIPVSGGTGPYVWNITSGVLPQGLSFNASGFIWGTPTYASGTTFTVSVTDQSYRTASRQLTLAVDPDQALAVSTASVPTGNVGQGYSTNLSAVGGTAAYRWSLDSGALPTGVYLEATGRISGTFVAAGTYNFVAKVTDALNRTATKAFTMVVGGTGTGSGASSVRVSTAVLPDAVTGVWYGYNLGAEGGTAPYAWSLVSGEVPAGLAFEAGSVYGSPTRPGTYAFTVKVTDASGASAVQALSLVVHPTVVPGAGTGGSVSTGSGSTGSGSTGTGSTGLGTATADTEARLRALDRIGVSVDSLVKLPDDGNASTQADSAVYFIGADGRRHAFPNANTFFTWYSNFNEVRVVSSADLAGIPLGGNVTYHPGARMVKFTTDSRVYVVAGSRTLRPIASEAVARTLYGADWNRKIDDIADTFYTDYRFGAEVAVAGDFDLSLARDAADSISDTL